MTEFLMPSLGADMEAATVVEWRVKPGDAVKRGDIVAAVETDKGIIDIEVFEEGILQQILVPVGEKVSVGAVLAIFNGADQKSSKPPADPVEKEQPKPVLEPTQADQNAVPTPTAEKSTQRISPAAKKRAKALSVDLANVKGTGAQGAITTADVEQAAGNAKPDAMRQAIAAAMSRSKQEIPHYYLATTVDMTDTLDWLAEKNTNLPVQARRVYAVLLIKAVALALAEVPELNGYWVDGQFKSSNKVNIGMAISLRQGGLIAPALHDVRGKTLDTLMAEFRDLVSRARAGRISRAEFTEASITVSSLGEQGVEMMYSIIHPPQVAIVSFGSVIERPWCVDGAVVPRKLIDVSLAADHRASDGHRGALFLNHVNQYLQQPELL